MRTPASQRLLTLLLAGQILLTVAAFAVLGVALATSTTGMLLSGGFLLHGALLMVGGIMGLAARSTTGRVRAGIVLLAPAVLALASLLTPAAPEVGHEGIPDEMLRSLQHTLEVLTWAARLMFAAAVLSTVAGVVILTASRRGARAAGAASGTP